MNDKEIIEKQKEEIKKLKEKLQKYTNPSCYKKYYEKNKDKILNKKKERYYKNKEENKS
jgi:hypothetical protein